jgi:hypothetical protein
LNNQASVVPAPKVPPLIHIICLYVDGILSIPTTLISINGVPSVDAIAIPP